MPTKRKFSTAYMGSNRLAFCNLIHALLTGPPRTRTELAEVAGFHYTSLGDWVRVMSRPHAKAIYIADWRIRRPPPPMQNMLKAIPCYALGNLPDKPKPTYEEMKNAIKNL